MGYDVYGNDPIINEIQPVILNKPFNEVTKKERDAYFEAQRNHEKINPGIYFRNNVWFWRPLWNFVCEVCQDFLSQKDMNKGCSNSGEVISKTKAKKIAKKLFQCQQDGVIEEYGKMYRVTQKKAGEYAEMYPFSEENVVDFAKFAEQSGGFQIC